MLSGREAAGNEATGLDCVKRRDDGADAAKPARSGGTAASDVWRPGGAGGGIGGGTGPARAIASLVPRITQKSFEKHGFAAASLITDWAQIVERDLARNTRPMKLKWPRTVEKFSETAESCGGRPGATLVLQVDPAIALDIQYQSAQLIERVNAYFGYRAVANLRLVQEAIGHDSPDERSRAGGTAPGTEKKPLENSGLSQPGADEDPLSAALARLGAHVAAQIHGRKTD